MANMNRNTMPMEVNTTLTVCMLIDGKEILPQALCNEEVAKGVITGWTNVEPKRLQALNESPSYLHLQQAFWLRRLESPLRKLITG